MRKADYNGVLRQGAEYEETESAAPQNAKIKKDKKPFLIIGGVVAAVILVAIALPKQRANDAENSQTSLPTATQEVEIFFRYTPEELDKLRSYGYTADEIEAGERDFVSADLLAEKARENQESIQREIMAKVNDASSPEYKKL